MIRYAANLLLEYDVDEAPSQRPLCERRIVLIEARGPREAIRRAKQLGKRAENSYRNADGQTFRVKFVGLIDVISLEHSEESEAYYSMRRTSHPERHVRPDDAMSVLTSGSKNIGSSWWVVPEWLVRGQRQRKRRKRGA
jgi:hypothetical protein